MGKLILVTGGARSGKSSYAERLAAEASSKVLYMATATAFDEEMQDRIKKHRAQRPSEWDTHEGYKDLGEALTAKCSHYEAILLDCVTVMLTNLLWEYPGMNFDEPSTEIMNEAETYVRSEFEKFLEAASKYEGTLIMVTNELGCGLVPENPLARAFRDIAGRVNQLVAAKCNEVYLTVCGIPMKIK